MISVKKLLYAAYRILCYVIIAAAAALGVMYLAGIRPYAVKTGSMSPEIEAGSICFVNTNVSFGEINKGDIIAFTAGEDMLVMHRAVGIDPEGITTKGDANNAEDSSKVTEDSFIGRTAFWTPSFGRVIAFARTGFGKMTFIGAVVLLLLVGMMFELTQDNEAEAKENEEENADPAENGGTENVGEAEVKEYKEHREGSREEPLQ